MARNTWRYLAALLVAGQAAAAQDTDSITLATELGAVLAGGELCGYTFDSAAIIAFVRDNVPPDDMSFPSMLTTMVTGSKFQLQDLSQSALIAQCAAVENTARHYGFMK